MLDTWIRRPASLGVRRSHSFSPRLSLEVGLHIAQLWKARGWRAFFLAIFSLSPCRGSRGNRLTQGIWLVLQIQWVSKSEKLCHKSFLRDLNFSLVTWARDLARAKSSLIDFCRRHSTWNSLKTTVRNIVCIFSWFQPPFLLEKQKRLPKQAYMEEAGIAKNTTHID